ncbi:MarR family transcriptional regulator [Azospirillum doebereinerae]|uniref:MarR family transcriptional regulator n=1 Tax=Azospirillum doebereinerae TaxID=92933 RepID=A0A433JAQ5_9PROT|nr:MarR family transcriptional regulator [Azospirillum doebereinerae]MCG5242138.1 MarR family transcriptional regulator [Azospirillum doebereinerae]RUQ72920.1 MarR family transcriptional regulator [Azospirillum doebereinerae]
MQSAATPAVYTDLGRVMESITRRFLDVLRMELARIGVTDLSPTQALMLLHIGGEELSVRDLLERGYYLGSNASYNLKHLVEAGYVDRAASQRDRRAARLRLSERGLATCEGLRRLEAVRADSLLRSEADGADFETTYRTLRRLERAWTDLIRYDDAPKPS